MQVINKATILSWITLLFNNNSRTNAFIISSNNKKLQAKTTTTTPTQLFLNDIKKDAQEKIQSINADINQKVETFNTNIDPFVQRIESVKCGVVGALSGGIALTPIGLIHDTLFKGNNVVNGLAQWEFDTDMGSLQAALFAIVYRYCVRKDDNPMLKMGVVGAFIFVRTLSKIQVPVYCSGAPLDCGAPLGYFDWEMISQGTFAGIESIALFGVSAHAIEYCFRRGFISKMK